MTKATKRQRLWVLAIAILVGLGGILYGYDIGVVSGALLFIQKTIPMTDTQTGLIVGAVLGGGLIGTLLAGPFADQWGRRTTIAASSMIFIVGVGLILLANSFITLLLARVFLGIGVGVVAVAVPLYVAELMPKEDRGRYVTFFQLFLTFGIVLAYFVDYLLTPSGSWRGMFAVVLIPALVLLLGVLVLPETPRWLMSKGCEEKAKRILLRMRSKEQTEQAMKVIQDSLAQTQGSWSELLSAKFIFPLFIGVAIAILNQWVGINVFLQYAPEILKQTGLGSNSAVMMGTIGIGLLNLICTIIAAMIVDRVGRKPLLYVGVLGVLISEIYLGFVNYLLIPPHLMGVLSLVGLFAFIVFFAIGPGVVVWLAISELLPTKVRGKGIAICLFFSSFSGWLMASIFLDLRNWLGMDGAYWLCAGFAFLYLLVAHFLLPETKAKSLEEIQHYFTDNNVIEDELLEAETI